MNTGVNVKANFDEMYDYPLSIELLKINLTKLSIKIQKEIENLDKDKKICYKLQRLYRSFIGPTLRKMFLKSIPKKYGELVLIR